LWNVADGRELATLDAPISAEVDWDEASGVALTTNGEHLTVLWQVGADGSWTRAAPLADGVPQGNTTSVAIAPGGNLLAFAAADGVVLVERESGVPVARLRDEVPISFTMDCVFSPDGERLALIDVEGTLRLWHLPELRRALAALELNW
jgi:WD40 repeat protein